MKPAPGLTMKTPINQNSDSIPKKTPASQLHTAFIICNQPFLFIVPISMTLENEINISFFQQAASCSSLNFEVPYDLTCWFVG